MWIDYLSEAYNSGGEYRGQLTYQEMADLLGKMATRENNWGSEGGGELAQLQPPFLPPDIGSIALRPPSAEPILELVR